MTRVSVVVPTFERAASLPGLIAALEAQTLPAEAFDVIVVDDGSRDDTRAVLERLSSRASIRLRVVRNQENRGPSAARNLGWRSSDAPVIAFTDDDCLPAPRWLESGLTAFDGGSAGIVQGRTIPDPAAPNKGFTKTMQIERFSNLYQSCNIFYRTDVLRATDGFDEDITVPFGEDTALGWKAQRLRVTAEFAPDAVVHHAVTHPSVRYWWRYAMMHRNFATLVRRFPEMRREMFWCRVFVWRNHAVFVVALSGVIAGTVWRPAFALALPYAYLRRPRRLEQEELAAIFQGTAFDAAILAGLLIGSVRERRLVL